MGFEDGIQDKISKVAQEEAPHEEVIHERVLVAKEGAESTKMKMEATPLERADEEIARAADFLRLEDQAVQFRGAVEKLGIPWSADTAGQYENEYAVPATLQAETLQDTIAQNSDARNEAAQESKGEKSFNDVSRIMEDKKALCIHIMTGLSNDLNDTTRNDSVAPNQLAGLSPDDPRTADQYWLIRKKAEREALSQLKTLAGLNPSVSTSFFADTHDLEGSWWRDQSQSIGAILRGGECVGISSQDAGTSSRSVKRRVGAEAVTEERLTEVLSLEDTHFSKSGYNEAIISEPKIGALFVPTKGSASLEIFRALQGESIAYGYPVFLESGGKFFELSRDDMDALLQNDGERVSVAEYLRDEKMIPRDEIRKRMSALDSQDLEEREKTRFDEYLEHYELKPHFSWSEELATTVDTELAFHLGQEERRLGEYKEGLRTESEKDGALTKRLLEYFRKNPGLKKSYEENERLYVDGVLYEGTKEEFIEAYRTSQFPEGAKVERRVTKIWEYEENIVDPPIPTGGVQGIGEVSTIQKTSSTRLFVMQSPDGSVFYRAAENMRLLVNKSNAKTGEVMSSRDALHYLSCEELEKTDTGSKKIDGRFKEDVYDSYKPELARIHQAGESFIDTMEAMRKKIAENELRAKDLKQASMYTKTLVEMYRKSGDDAMADEWQGIMENVFPDADARYDFVRAKLNSDGTLKLDKSDAEEL